MRGVRHHRRHWSERLVRYAGWFVAVTIVLTLLIALSLGSIAGLRPLLPLLLIPLAASVAGLLSSPITQRQLARNPAQGRPTRVEIGPDAFATEVEGASSARWSWEVVREVVRTSDGMLVYVGRNQFAWVPAHAFDSAEEAETAYRIAEAHAPRFRQAA